MKNIDLTVDKETEKYNKLKDKIDETNPWKIIELFLEIEPKPYARPRKSKKLENAGKKNPFYNPRDGYKKKLKKEIEKKIKEAYNSFQIIDGEVHLIAEFGLEPPKQYTESKNKWKLVKDKIITPIVRPDVDNWIKPVMDVLNKLVYNDDGQITILHTEKVYSTIGHPYIKIKIVYRQEPIKLR